VNLVSKSSNSINIEFVTIHVDTCYRSKWNLVLIVVTIGLVKYNYQSNDLGNTMCMPINKG
jgi:hypothetical protein